jgi:mannose/cellobiose epimerase-like protein (N-acyl-D-glucosamine 2-epimerase family)
VVSRRNEGLFVNPQMHMLEACLASEGEVRDDATGVQLSNEIVTLTKESLLGPPTGARHESCAEYGRTGHDPQLSIPGHGSRDPGGRSRLMFH